MDVQLEKVYVAVGSDLQDGFATLEWALRKWDSNSTSIVIIHATNSISKDFVYTPCKFHYSAFGFHFFRIQLGVHGFHVELLQLGSFQQVL